MHLRASGEGSGRADRGDEDSSRELHFDIIFCFNLLSRTNCESKGIRVENKSKSTFCRRGKPWQPKNTTGTYSNAKTYDWKEMRKCKIAKIAPKNRSGPRHDKGIMVVVSFLDRRWRLWRWRGQKKDRNCSFEFSLAGILHFLIFIGQNHLLPHETTELQDIYFSLFLERCATRCPDTHDNHVCLVSRADGRHPSFVWGAGVGSLAAIVSQSKEEKENPRVNTPKITTTSYSSTTSKRSSPTSSR